VFGAAIRVTDTNAAVLRPLLEPWFPDVQVGQPMFAVVVGGHAVSVCCSVRETAEAFEAGVETVAAHRRRGYAPRAVTAWAREVRAMGRVPLYSTSWQNEASRAVARALGLIHFGTDLHIA
jgi:predicted GNAT family acetyltransferase